MLVERIVASPIGPLRLLASGDELVAVELPGLPPSRTARVGASAALDQAARELAAYFEGRSSTFETRLAPEGTPFQREVWAALREIPAGETRTYGAIARAIARPKAVRAVGMANHRNPLPLFVPCHRVVGADGTLVGFAGGLEMKRALLAHEQRFAGVLRLYSPTSSRKPAGPMASSARSRAR